MTYFSPDDLAQNPIREWSEDTFCVECGEVTLHAVQTYTGGFVDTACCYCGHCPTQEDWDEDYDDFLPDDFREDLENDCWD